MSYTVNESCIGCGLCAELCPEVFTIGESGTAAAAAGGVPAGAEAAATQAMDSCPAAAIERI